MTNVTRDVQRFLDNDTAIRKDLSRGFINRRALAQYLQKLLRIVGGVDAVISAVRRYETGLSEENRFEKAGALIRNAKISTRTGIAIIALEKASEVQGLLPKLFSVIHYERGEVLRIVQAEESIKVIVDERNVDKVLAIFRQGNVIKIERSLAEVNMKLAPVSAKVPGVLAMLDTELANNDVNIVETISCVPELLWFVDSNDLLKAHKTFLDLMESLRERK
ncbi:hypothetical protein HYU12_04880 [Candidatus Woesearchaeota archaeon]|nr:hypothetical protein [Candidatus Woesearchaeota archaeon]